MIGKAIYEILSGNTDLTDVIDLKIYPLVITEDTELPAVMYSIDIVVPEYTKDGWEYDACRFKVTSYAKEYSDVLDVASKVRSALEFVRGTYGGVVINHIYMDSQEEFYQIDADVYIIRLTFNVVINDNG